MAVVLVGFGTLPARAQDHVARDGMVVRRVEFRGLVTISEGFVRRSVKTREAQNYTRAQVEADVRELLQTRKFVNVFADAAVEDGQVVVVFSVEEKPEVRSVELAGNVKFKNEELFPLVPAPGQPLDRYEADRGRDEIIRKYREAGYYYVQVELDEPALTQEHRLFYRITEGPRVKVRKIRFEGVRSFSERELGGKLQTKTYIWVFRTGALDEDQVARDAVTLEQFYRNEGFLDARCSYRLDFDAVQRGDLNVVFVLEEGTRYRVKEVDVAGNAAFATETLRATMQLNPGDYFRDEVLQHDVRAVQDMYGEIGYVDARVATAYDYLDEPGTVRLRYALSESTRSRVGRISVHGNTETQDRVIRRELRLFPGDDFNMLRVREAERRLRETSLFSKATITPLADVGGEREALVEVEETDAILFLVGAGVSTDSGLLGSISLTNRNFDLTDWPRTWGEFVRGRAFRGAGQTLRLTAEPGTKLTRFRIDFVEPYLGERPVRLGSSFYLWQRGRDKYDEQRFGTTWSLGRRFESGPLDGWALEGALRLEGVDVNNVDKLAAREIREAKGSHPLTAAKVGLVRDTTDSRFVPSRGYRFNINWEQVGALGGDYTFGQPGAGITWYKTLHTDLLDRKSVLALRADTGFIVGDAPVFEKYYGGGFGSIRGFRFRGVSPRNGIGDDAIGGNFILLTGSEYSFPIYGDDTVRGVTFVDMGTVEESFQITGWRASIGVGLRIKVDFFGGVPIVLDFAVPMAKEKDDETEIFNFSFGASF
jgi:outer membrane protein insertion porin family